MPRRYSRVTRSPACRQRRTGWGIFRWSGGAVVGFGKTIDKKRAAFFASLKPYLGQVGNWLLARSAQIGGGVLELALSLVLVFFFYRDGPRLAEFAHSLLERLIGERAAHYLELVAVTVQRVVLGAFADQ